VARTYRRVLKESRQIDFMLTGAMLARSRGLKFSPMASFDVSFRPNRHGVWPSVDIGLCLLTILGRS
ncbi:MAG: hypothetical protein AAFQ22_13760, partial [Pseudomonadota bacterium]